MRDEPILGIDLGSSWAKVAWVDAEGVARVLSSIPSVVHFRDDGRTWVVGAPALAMRFVDPANTRRSDRADADLSALILEQLKADAERAARRSATWCSPFRRTSTEMRGGRWRRQGRSPGGTC